MKKVYINPLVKIVNVIPHYLICVSGGERGVDFGGGPKQNLEDDDEEEGGSGSLSRKNVWGDL